MPALMALEKPERYDQINDLSSPSTMERNFLALYPRRDIYIQKRPNQKKWTQNKRLLQDFQILGVIEDGGRGLLRGCYFGELTKFAVLDIDAGSRYHSHQELQKLKLILAGVNLSGITYGSSESGGWHLYLPLSDWISSKEVETGLKQFLKIRGYELKGGTLEVFPSGNALRLPLQPGFAFLDQDTEVEARRDELTRDVALRRFLTDFQRHENDWSEAEALINSELARHRDAQEAKHKEAISIEGFDQLYDEQGKDQERWELGQKLWKEGLLERGQRHDGVLAVGHYLWYGDPDRGVPSYPGNKYDRTRAKIIEAWLEKKHNGHCRHINEGRWDVVREQIARATVWREKSKPVVREPYPLTERLLKRLLEVYRNSGQLWEVARLEAANNFREEEARARIADAVKWIVENQAPRTISEVARVAGSNRRTVKRHIDLLGIWPSVYITGGVRGGFPAPEVSAGVDQLFSGGFDPDKKNYSSSASESDTLTLASQPDGLTEEGENKEIPFGFFETQGVLSAFVVLPAEAEQKEPEVAPLPSCLAQEPIRAPQCQTHDLEAWLIGLTPGPERSDIQAGTAGCTGGIFLCSSTGVVGQQSNLVPVDFTAGVILHRKPGRKTQTSYRHLIAVCLCASGVCFFADKHRRFRNVFLPDRRSGQRNWGRGPPSWSR
jgi:hypothetical protein